MTIETELSSQTKQKRLYLIDAYGFVFRAYHVLPPLTSPDGIPVGAVLGFVNMLLKQMRDRADKSEENHMLVVFDSGEKTFRNEIYSEYKANRPPAPDDLIPQFPIMREVAAALGLPSVGTEGYEADDLIAAYSKLAEEKGYNVTIISSDKDLMQLVGGNIEMYDAMKNKKIGVDEVHAKFGVMPDKVLDILSLMGDSSDNIPGVPGIGPKTAAELINMFGSTDGIIENIDNIKQNKRRETLRDNVDNIHLSKKLASLDFNAPVESDLDKFLLKDLDQEKLFAFLNKYGFKSLITRMGGKPEVRESGIRNQESKKEISYKTLKEKEAIEKWLTDAEVGGKLAIYPAYDNNKISGIALAKAIGEACFINIGKDKSGEQGAFDFGDSSDSNKQNDLLEAIKPYLAKDYIIKIGHDIKSLLKHEETTPIDDISVMSYILDGTRNKHDIHTLAELHIGVSLPKDITDEKDLCKTADIIFQLHQIFRKRLFDEKMLTVYETIEKPLIEVLSHMEKAGVKINVEVLKKLSSEFSVHIEDMEKEIHKIADSEFNIGSPKQMGEILFDKMGIEGGKKSKKTGAYSTGADVLEKLSAEGHDIASKILEWREFSKLKSTYTDALVKHINPETGRIHTTFNMVTASTGRLSSVDPNLQNIPIRSEEGRKIRSAFIVDKENVMLSADYSQIELRLLAHYADIEPLKIAFHEGKDIHAATASQVFNVPLEEVDSDLRRSAKTINFGIIYGQSAFGLANQLGISRTEAASYIDKYFAQYPGIKQYMEVTKEYAREHGFVKTLYGRKCFLNGIKAGNPSLRAFAERAAINAPLQGTAADIIKKAMIKIYQLLNDKHLKSQMILQVHDELLFEAPADELNQVKSLVKKEMENVISLSVPVIVDVKYGGDWNEAH